MSHFFDRAVLDGVIDKVGCPLLIVHGENDRQIPLKHAIKIFEAATSQEMKIFRIDEGGSEHCQLDNHAFGADYIADWFADLFGSNQ
jgi:fermentation-respiration switch protein FrsA (DUF1100 family)